jgi:UDP-glucose 4-epimerase
MLEQILSDIQKADQEWNVILLRYFNPIGAHPSGTMGENPNGIPNNLMPYITQVAVGRQKELGVFGNDYDTHDGTCVRDYIHVTDLGVAHSLALNKLMSDNQSFTVNLGTGKGTSVKEIVDAVEKVIGKKLNYDYASRRAGDPAMLTAKALKAKEILGWEPKYTDVEDIIRTVWNIED